MTEPEETIREALENVERVKLKDAALEALASLRQRQEELERKQVSAFEAAVKLKSQLQQAEQERESWRRWLDDAHAGENDATECYLSERTRAVKAESQLQQAETALRALQEAAEGMGGIDTEVGWIDVSLTSEQAATIAAGLAALAAPPPNPKDVAH